MSNQKDMTENTKPDAAIDTARLLVEGRPIDEWLADRRIENGTIMGVVRTNKVGSECYFAIMELGEFKEQAAEGDFEEIDSFEEIAKEAMWESGYLEWNF